jgi:hypothetical protein
MILQRRSLIIQRRIIIKSEVNVQRDEHIGKDF